ncbi:MAG TPA: DoxX family protein [Ignavibacteria bacterium]|nr:DoxX family protein [Bacteroidota bacterium]HRE11985.1 DoxX family protein [Ignavibacteria bacterium]HRF65783.1 DoxX family protein [Ignavibacteria bacterium]HRJ03235.1 DoxX family protein [Ignavibacteria bacterium]HRJ85160.1 DoxX family protein [Ignavibacteria bacterium]
MKRAKRISLIVMIAFYVFAGLAHFIYPEFYLPIMPPYLPYHLELVYISGAFEILLALLLIPIKTRKAGAWLLIALLVAVFPANIQMFINYLNANDPDLWISIVRLPIQLLLIWWAWGFTKTTLQKNITANNYNKV